VPRDVRVVREVQLVHRDAHSGTGVPAMMLLTSPWVKERAVFWVGDLVPERYVLSTKVRSRRTAVFCADCTSEAENSQPGYFGAVHGLWLILVRIDGAFV